MFSVIQPGILTCVSPGLLQPRHSQFLFQKQKRTYCSTLVSNKEAETCVPFLCPGQLELKCPPGLVGTWAWKDERLDRASSCTAPNALVFLQEPVRRARHGPPAPLEDAGED